VLLAIEKLAASGRDVQQFIRDLAAHLRHVFVTRTLGEVPETFSVTAEHGDRIRSQADRISDGALLRAIDVLSGALVRIKEGADARIQLELALTKAARPDTHPSLEVLSLRIEELERRVAVGENAPAPATQPARAAGTEKAAARESERPSSPSRSTDSAEGDQPPSSGNGASSSGAASPPAETPARPPQRSQGASPPAASGSGSAGPALAVQDAQKPSSPDREAATVLDLDTLRSLWSAVVDAVRSENAMVAALLVEARPASLTDRSLTVALPPGAGFTKRKVEENAALVREALRRLTGRPLAVAFELSDGAGDDTGAERSRLLTEEELLERLKEEFGAREIFDDEAPTREE
jgi:DNA polymerase III subunit gamma/tau